MPVQVDVEGELACPRITWFIDCATKMITGVAVTPHAPGCCGGSCPSHCPQASAE
ncbi:hypothetical protein [Kitasatospora mediocidica]|uniref:hypothetical protein n=1 Tax=Kitasatospora mediocidica TaxID=58352 RepID=UPI000A49E2C5|nr:hypothetical protein [Kitasatospora mediocidica]